MFTQAQHICMYCACFGILLHWRAEGLFFHALLDLNSSLSLSLKTCGTVERSTHTIDILLPTRQGNIHRTATFRKET